MLPFSSAKHKSNDKSLSAFSSKESSSFQTTSCRLPALFIGCHLFVSNFVVASKLSEHRCKSTGLLNASNAYVLVNLNAARSSSCSELPSNGERSQLIKYLRSVYKRPNTYPVASVDKTMRCCHLDL